MGWTRMKRTTGIAASILVLASTISYAQEIPYFGEYIISRNEAGNLMISNIPGVEYGLRLYYLMLQESSDIDRKMAESQVRHYGFLNQFSDINHRLSRIEEAIHQTNMILLSQPRHEPGFGQIIVINKTIERVHTGRIRVK